MRLDMPCVETAHLLLRPVEEGDVCDMFAYYSDPLVMRYLSLHPHTDIEETLNSIRSYFLTWEKRGVPQAWVMVHKHDDKVIGNLDIHTIDGDIGEIGYLMHPDYWNQGLMREAVSALVKAGFAHVGLRRMEAYVAVEHPASAAVLKRCGFVQEGILRKLALLSDGRYHDMVLMSILKEDILTESFRLDK